MSFSTVCRVCNVEFKGEFDQHKLECKAVDKREYCNHCKNRHDKSDEYHLKYNCIIATLCQFECGEIIKRSEIDEHTKICKALIKCEYCDGKFKIIQLETHQADGRKCIWCETKSKCFDEKHNCELQPIQCEHCKFVFSKSKMDEHLSACGKKPDRLVKCERCSDEIKFCDKQDHLKNYCFHSDVKCSVCEVCITPGDNRLSNHYKRCMKRCRYCNLYCAKEHKYVIMSELKVGDEISVLDAGVYKPFQVILINKRFIQMLNLMTTSANSYKFGKNDNLMGCYYQ